MDTVIAKRIETKHIGREVGDWRIESRIDQGKSAVVFRAAGDNGLTAVKVFDPEMVERYGKKTQLARIERELQLKGQHHPNLIKILGGGECARTGYLFVAMDLVDAPNLGSVLTSVPPTRIWPTISQIASAARFLESLNLAHRDIKPGNIAISRDYHQAILLDLGVLRPFGVTGLTDIEKQSFVGTLQYSPPEFLVREEEDSLDGWRAVTFYQLGAVLHDLIMGEPIFANQSEPYGLLARAVERVIPKIENTSVPADLVVLAASCLQKDPRLRLDLVKWEHFDPPELRGDANADDPISRIRRRRAMAQQSCITEAETSAEQKARSARRTVQKLQADLHDCAQQECIGSELFPPLEIHDFALERANVGGFKIQFHPSSEHTLPNFLSIFIILELFDENSEAAKILCAAGVSAAPMETLSFASLSTQELFKGVYNRTSVSGRLKAMLYRALDKAQQTQPIAETTSLPRWLVDLTQDEVTK